MRGIDGVRERQAIEREIAARDAEARNAPPMVAFWRERAQRMREVETAAFVQQRAMISKESAWEDYRAGERDALKQLFHLTR